MAGFCETEWGCTGRLTLNGVDMHNPAWCTPLLTRLWWDRLYRGESTLLPGVPGRRSNPKRIDEVDIPIPIYINGLVDPAGVDYANAMQGLMENFALLESSVLDPSNGDVDRGLIEAIYVSPDGGDTFTFDVQVEALDFPDEIEDVTFVVGLLTITIPAGRMTP